MKTGSEYRPPLLSESRWGVWLPWCLSLVNLVLLVRLLASSSGASGLVNPLLVTLATSILVAVSIIPVLRVWIDRSVRRNLERELGSTFTTWAKGEDSESYDLRLHDAAPMQRSRRRIFRTTEALARPGRPRLIPAQGDLSSLGPPTLKVEGVSLSQLLEEQREERL